MSGRWNPGPPAGRGGDAGEDTVAGGGAPRPAARPGTVKGVRDRELSARVWHYYKQMSTSAARRFPVTVSHLPTTRCQICQRTLAYRPGEASSVLTDHYRRTHPEALGLITETEE
jgi:hypothetical protein